MPSGLPRDLLDAFQATWFEIFGERLSAERAEEASESLLDLAMLLGTIVAADSSSTDQA